MGHKKKGQKSAQSLHEQGYAVFHGMLTAGQGRSKRIDKEHGEMEGKIYSFSTFKTYMRQLDYYIDWLKKYHPEVTSLKKARKYAKEWLVHREASGKYSAFTLQLEAKVLGKFYGIKPEDQDYYTPPVRHREDIKRSRLPVKQDRHFSQAKNTDLVRFCAGTGLRRAGLTSIKSDCLYSASALPAIIERIKRKPESERSEKESAMLSNYHKLSVFKGKPDYYLVVCEKGGKWRFAPIIGPYTQMIVDKIQSTPPGLRVWPHVSKNLDVHDLRARYAADLYKMYARNIDSIPFDTLNKGSGKLYQGDVYIFRGNMKGTKLDKMGMLVVEVAIGHETLHTFASNYSRYV